MKSSLNIIQGLSKKWKTLYIMESLLLSIAVASVICAVALLLNLPFKALYFIVPLVIACSTLYHLRGLKKINEDNVLRLLNRQIPAFEESADLIVSSKENYNLLERIQKGKTEQILASASAEVKLPATPKSYLIYTFSGLLLLFLSAFFHSDEIIPSKLKEISTVLDNRGTSEQSITKDPAIDKLHILLNPPRYTGIRKKKQIDGDIKVPEGTKVSWDVGFTHKVDSVQINLSNNRPLILMPKQGFYIGALRLQDQGFYDISFRSPSAKTMHSPYYKIEIIPDRSPVVEIKNLNQYTEFEYNNDQKIEVNASLSDDYGLTESFIVATISKGSGEAVKFREAKFAFDQELRLGRKNAQLAKLLSLSDLQMTPGDELYFYVEARDNKTPKANITRTETYFIAIKDTAQVEFSLEGNLGVDLMPEYFRSQRQIIIDTEKLVASKKKITKQNFNSTSNELGFDQKTLRLKYGQFMGEESESGVIISDAVVEEVEGSIESHEGEEDPLEGFKHDHDNENEHNLVDQSVNEEDDEEDPLEDYKHAHDSEEVATFHNNTIKGKLRAAMALMWDAELYLRLYQPKNSLPFQYKALKLIKEIKNHARIYVQRIGFEPPPIKEDIRLTGELDDVKSSRSTAYHKDESIMQNIQLAIELLSQKLPNDDSIIRNQQEIFHSAGKELAVLVVQNPGKHIFTLQHLKILSNGKKLSGSELEKLRADLISILPAVLPEVSHATSRRDKLVELYYEAIQDQKVKEH